LQAAEQAVADLRAQGFDPEGYTLYTVAALQVFAEAARRAGSTELEQLVPVLHGTTFKTVVGEIAFDAKDPKYSIYRFQDGKYAEM
jgi:branched-chain amino acid transport system substrate-binding protein